MFSSTLAILGSTSTRCFSYAARCFSSSSADWTALVGRMNPLARTRLEGASRAELEGAERRERVKVVRRDMLFLDSSGFVIKACTKFCYCLYMYIRQGVEGI